MMLTQTMPENAQPTDAASSERHDYDVVREAVRFLSERRDTQPGLDALARHLGLEATACHKLFKRWCGLTPKEFLQAITLDHARQLLQQSATVLQAAHDSGLSGGGRLHDLCVSYDAVTPGAIKQRGAGATFSYGFHQTPFGQTVVLVTENGLAGLSFANDDTGETVEDALASYRQRWPAARFIAHQEATAAYVNAIFAPHAHGAQPQEIRIVLIGTDFEIQVWQALLQVPVAGAASYQMIAKAVGRPAATRAVGTAIGNNPISFVVPCHRVLRSDGGLGGYRWGITRKRAIIGWELGQKDMAAAS